MKLCICRLALSSSAEEAAAAFRDEADVFVYSRYGNPTVKMFEDRLALLEGTESCRATGSGMAAVFGAWPIVKGWRPGGGKPGVIWRVSCDFNKDFAALAHSDGAD